MSEKQAHFLFSNSNFYYKIVCYYVIFRKQEEKRVYLNLLYSVTCNLNYLKNVKLIRYQFWCTRCAFRLIKSRQWYLDRKSWKSEKQNVKNLCKEQKKKPWNWAKSVEGKSYAWGRYPSFLDEFIIFTFYLIVLFIFVFLSKYRST